MYLIINLRGQLSVGWQQRGIDRQHVRGVLWGRTFYLQNQ